jgi:uncharacterized membrane protein
VTALVWIARLLALAGFLDATYLTAVHFTGGEVVCGPSGGCETVLSSRFATIGGFPIAAAGAVYYAVASLLAWTPVPAWSRRTAGAFAALTGTAFAVSAVLFLLQATVLHAWCRFCLVSAGITTILFACALALVRAVRAAPGIEPAELSTEI